MAASFSMPGEGEPMIPVVFPARSTGIGIANRQARRRRARTGAQIFPRQSSGRGSPTIAPSTRLRRSGGGRLDEVVDAEIVLARVLENGEALAAHVLLRLAADTSEALEAGIGIRPQNDTLPGDSEAKA